MCVLDVKGAHLGATDSTLPMAAQVRTNMWWSLFKTYEPQSHPLRNKTVQWLIVNNRAIQVFITDKCLYFFVSPFLGQCVMWRPQQ